MLSNRYFYAKVDKYQPKIYSSFIMIAAYLIFLVKLEATLETFSLMNNPEFMEAIAQHKAGTMEFFDLKDLG